MLLLAQVLVNRSTDRTTRRKVLPNRASAAKSTTNLLADSTDRSTRYMSISLVLRLCQAKVVAA